LIYFHANAEDIGRCYELLDHIRTTVRINVLIPEYPGYGIYNKVKKGSYQSKNPVLEVDEQADGLSCSAEQIQQDSECVYDFVLKNFPKIQEKDIVIFGRSMGSGPTIHLGSTRKPKAIITMSAYTSIKNVVHDKLSFLSALVAEQFNNLETIKNVPNETSVLFLHGKKDKLVPYQHSVDLNDNLPKGVTSELILPDNMTHNDFDFYNDLIRPMFQFFVKISLDTNPTKRIGHMEVDEAFYLDQFFERYFKM
jgi:predicted esterase